MIDINALIALTSARDDRGVLMLACVHELSPPDLHKLCVERWTRSEAAQGKFPSAEIYAAHMVGRFAHYQSIAQAAADAGNKMVRNGHNLASS